MCTVVRPNASAQLLPEAGATQERTLEAVRCSARLCQNLLPTVCSSALLCRRSSLYLHNVLHAWRSSLALLLSTLIIRKHGPSQGRPSAAAFDEVQHPPEIVRQDRQTQLRPHLLQPSHQKEARVPPPFHRPKRVLHQLLALLHHLRPTAHPLLHLFQQVLIHPPCQPSSAFVARALRLERTGSTGGRRIIADMPPSSTVQSGT